MGEYVEYVKIGPASAFRKVINDYLNEAHDILEEMQKLSPEIEQTLGEKAEEVNSAITNVNTKLEEAMDDIDDALDGLNETVKTEVSSQIELQTEDIIKREVQAGMTEAIEEKIDNAANGLKDEIKQLNEKLNQKIIIQEDKPNTQNKGDYWYEIIPDESDNNE